MILVAKRDFDIQTCSLCGSHACATAFFLQVPTLYTDLDPTLLYISISEICSKFARQNEIRFLALGFCFPQPARAMTAYIPHLDHVWITIDQLVRFYKNKFNQVHFKLNYTENPCSFENYQSNNLQLKCPAVVCPVRVPYGYPLWRLPDKMPGQKFHRAFGCPVVLKLSFGTYLLYPKLGRLAQTTPGEESEIVQTCLDLKFWICFEIRMTVGTDLYFTQNCKDGEKIF